MAELKPCPWCGRKDVYVSWDYDPIFGTKTFSVDCKCGISGPLRGEKEQAISAWNKRSK